MLKIAIPGLEETVFGARELVYENALSSLRRDGTRVGNKMSVPTAIDRL